MNIPAYEGPLDEPLVWNDRELAAHTRAIGELAKKHPYVRELLVDAAIEDYLEKGPEGLEDHVIEWCEALLEERRAQGKYL